MSRVSQIDGLFWRMGRGWLPHGVEILMSARKREDGAAVRFSDALDEKHPQLLSVLQCWFTCMAVFTVAQLQGRLRPHDDWHRSGGCSVPRDTQQLRSHFVSPCIKPTEGGRVHTATWRHSPRRRWRAGPARPPAAPRGGQQLAWSPCRTPYSAERRLTTDQTTFPNANLRAPRGSSALSRQPALTVGSANEHLLITFERRQIVGLRDVRSFKKTCRRRRALSTSLTPSSIGTPIKANSFEALSCEWSTLRRVDASSSVANPVFVRAQMSTVLENGGTIDSAQTRTSLWGNIPPQPTSPNPPSKWICRMWPGSCSNCKTIFHKIAVEVPMTPCWTYGDRIHHRKPRDVDEGRLRGRASRRWINQFKEIMNLLSLTTTTKGKNELEQQHVAFSRNSHLKTPVVVWNDVVLKVPEVKDSNLTALVEEPNVFSTCEVLNPRHRLVVVMLQKILPRFSFSFCPISTSLDSNVLCIRAMELTGASVAERLACSPPTKANRVQSPAVSLPDFRMWESCGTMTLVGGFSRGPSVSLVLSFGVAPFSLKSLSSAFKTSLLRAAKISSLTLDHTVRFLVSHQGEPGSNPGRTTPGYSYVGIVPDDATSRSPLRRCPILAPITLIGSQDFKSLHSTFDPFDQLDYSCRDITQDIWFATKTSALAHRATARKFWLSHKITASRHGPSPSFHEGWRQLKITLASQSRKGRRDYDAGALQRDSARGPQVTPRQFNVWKAEVHELYCLRSSGMEESAINTNDTEFHTTDLINLDEVDVDLHNNEAASERTETASGDKTPVVTTPTIPGTPERRTTPQSDATTMGSILYALLQLSQDMKHMRQEIGEAMLHYQGLEQRLSLKIKQLCQEPKQDLKDRKKILIVREAETPDVQNTDTTLSSKEPGNFSQEPEITPEEKIENVQEEIKADSVNGVISIWECDDMENEIHQQNTKLITTVKTPELFTLTYHTAAHDSSHNRQIGKFSNRQSRCRHQDVKHWKTKRTKHRHVTPPRLQPARCYCAFTIFGFRQRERVEERLLPGKRKGRRDYDAGALQRDSARGPQVTPRQFNQHNSLDDGLSSGVEGGPRGAVPRLGVSRAAPPAAVGKMALRASSALSLYTTPLTSCSIPRGLLLKTEFQLAEVAPPSPQGDAGLPSQDLVPAHLPEPASYWRVEIKIKHSINGVPANRACLDLDFSVTIDDSSLTAYVFAYIIRKPVRSGH
ncbi:hypothetical protein PR048_001503 [Dryococelus australis]|uniref:Uncharacterized protein n=1 Tax=Dryococelus australis TaxID=614101 RepID=A0ABQ9IHJ5_9NEOP|nr:hypothetical protein PR048_001503 [Dryococelus australis]